MHLKDAGDRIQAALNSVYSHFLLYFQAAPRTESCTMGLLQPRSPMPIARLLVAVGRDQHFHARASAELCASLA